MGVDGLHDPARVRELVQRFGRNILLGGGVDEIVEYCGPEAGLDRAELAPQLAYLWNLVEGDITMSRQETASFVSTPECNQR